VLAEPGHFSQYSKTTFRHWGMKAVCPFAWVERRLPLKIGLVAVRVAMDEGAGASVTENGRVTNECVTSDNAPPSYSQPRKSVVPARTPIGEGRVHSLQPQARLNHTTMARTTRSTVTTQPDKDKLSPASDDAPSTSLSKNKKSKKRKRDSVNEHEDQPATKLPRQEEDTSHSPKSEDLQSPPPIITETYLDSDLAQQILETLEMYVGGTNILPLRFQFTTVS
jgi:hypothetical protein